MLLSKYTCSIHNKARRNDLMSLILGTFSDISENFRLGVTGTDFSGEDIDLFRSCVAKQDEDFRMIVGQSLIETKEDLLVKMKSIMNVTEELATFIDTSIHKYLPLRRRIFSMACSFILKTNKNTVESFEAAFDDSLELSKAQMVNRIENLEYEKNSQDILIRTLLKFFSLFDHCIFDHTYLGALLPQNIRKKFISTGIVPYYTFPHVNIIAEYEGKLKKSDSGKKSFAELPVRFLFNEPLCKKIAKELCGDMKFRSKFWCDIFALLVPKKNEQNSRFDDAFTIILTYLSSKKMKICKLPFCDIIKNNNENFPITGNQTNFQKQQHKFLKSKSVFTFKAAISSKTIKSFLSSNLEALDDTGKNDLLLILSLEENDDNIYWKVFCKENLFHLLVNVCYFPDKNAHTGCWILSKLARKDKSPTRQNCGFFSFAFKLHRELDISTFKQENSDITVQSSMEYIYSTRLNGKEKLTEDDLKSDSFENILSFTDAAKEIRNVASGLPNLPIVVSLCEDKSFPIHEEAQRHALQITSSSIDNIFKNAFELFSNN